MSVAWIDLPPPAHLPLADGRIAYHDTGGAGPLVVLLHGGGVDRRMWARQLGPLSRRHRVLVPDARGHGASSTPLGPFRPHEDVARLLDHVNAGPAALVGLSMGAGTAVDTALDHPELVSRVVVCGAGTSAARFSDPWTLSVLAEWERTQRELDAPGWIEAFLRFVAGPHRADSEVDRQVLDEVRLMVTDTLAHHLPSDPATARPHQVFGDDPWARLPGLTAPLLGLVGELDSTDHVELVARAVRAVPHGELVTLPGTAHYPSMERPDQFTEAVLRFLDLDLTG
ncbi:alpha/beta fold hydrolase [Pseudonocardia spinosispora]|uniref:alpha/beta fold hydrolase n=1 Tax=Pseudonocardia spinosispora TaxID=103441 RepID=UPI0006856C8E|nr:alpha/beta hydrolase [Pseudonocardia spinosispora]